MACVAPNSSLSLLDPEILERASNSCSSGKKLAFLTLCHDHPVNQVEDLAVDGHHTTENHKEVGNQN